MAHPWMGVRPFLRHSLVLAVAGGVYIAIGITYLRSEPTAARTEALYYAVKVMEYNQWGWIFILAGLLSVVSSRWPPVSETWGYFVLTGQGAAWSGFYLVGVLFHNTPNSNLSATLSWGLIAFMWWAISGLVNPNALTKLLNQILALQAENLALHREIERLRGDRPQKE